jgi:hypothetical protein
MLILKPKIRILIFSKGGVWWCILSLSYLLIINYICNGFGIGVKSTVHRERITINLTYDDRNSG